MFYYFIFFVFTCVAVSSDLRTREIPNLITLGGSVVGIVLSFVLFGQTAIVLSLFAVLISLLVSVFAFKWELVGGGDAKLLIMFASFLWYPNFIHSLIHIAIAGGVVSLILTLKESWFTKKSLELSLKTVYIPYSLAFFFGLISFYLFR